MLYMSWTTSWATEVVNGLQSVPQRVHDGIRIPRPSAPYTQVRGYAASPRQANEVGRGRMEEPHSAAYTQVRNYAANPRSANEIGRGGMEESHSAAAELTGGHDGLANNLWEGHRVQDRIKSPQASVLRGEAELTGGQEVKEGPGKESEGVFVENFEIEMA